MKIELAVGLAFAATVYGQSFDAATIKLSGEFGPGMRTGCKGGPGTDDPSSYVCRYVPFGIVLSDAFDVQRYQLSAPQWIDSLIVDITARVPPGTTKEQFHSMLRNLIAERFGLKFHRDTRQAQGYELVVGKSGPKMKPAMDTHGNVGEVELRRLGRDADGFPVLPLGRDRMSVIRIGGPRQIVWERANETMDELATSIGNALRAPVHNATGLEGRYEVRLNYSKDSSNMPLPPIFSGHPPEPVDDDVPTIFSSVQERLGLKLEPKKVSGEFVVIDHLDKTPADN